MRRNSISNKTYLSTIKQESASVSADESQNFLPSQIPDCCAQLEIRLSHVATFTFLMDLTNFITNDKNELIDRGSYKNILWFAILMTIPCIGLLTDSFANWKSFLLEHLYGGLALLGFTYGVTICAWYKVFDKRIKLIINKNGFWH
jgi:hypothetical protein